MVYVFTGDGKGKTSAALGVAMRTLLIGKKVLWISWYKSNDWDISEKHLVDKFDNLEMYWAGRGFYIKNAKSAKVNQSLVFDYTTKKSHQTAAKEALIFAESILKQVRDKNRDVDLMVFDEINQTVEDGLLSASSIKKLINNRGEVNIILTGRKFSKELVECVDLITDMRKQKHPFDAGMMAVKGLDF